MDVRLLGPFEVWDGSDRLPVGSGKQAALLALLVLHGGEAVSNEPHQRMSRSTSRSCGKQSARP